jgi:mono/diheme cytochrome c family protein
MTFPRFLAPALLSLLAGSSLAGEHGHEGRQGLRAPLLAQYRQECGSCHTAYAPGLLPPDSWRQLMGGLASHFGTDASLDAATTKTIAAWLAEAGRPARGAEAPPPDNRITRSAWFVRKHREVSAATWRLPAVKSASNCSACHAGAEQGDFDEHAVRIPR